MSFLAQAPMVAVAAPLLAALIAAAMQRWPGVARLAGALASLVGLIAATLLARSNLDRQPVRYEVGGWEPPWGIELVVDAVNAPLLFLLFLVATALFIAAGSLADRWLSRERRGLGFALLSLCLAGLAGMTVTGDLFNAFVFMEISSLSAYALVALGPHRSAPVAAWRYLIAGTVGATLYLLGVGLLYAATGSLNAADLHSLIPPLLEGEQPLGRAARAGLAFFAVGLAIKGGLFPLHLWLVRAYSFASPLALPLLAAASTKVSLYLLLRVLSVFGGLELDIFQLFGWAWVAVSVVGALYASAAALTARDLGSVLAWSTIAQMAYVSLALGFALVSGHSSGLAAALIYLFADGLAKGTLFLCLGAVATSFGSLRLSDCRGWARSMPWTFAAFAVAALSLMGAPPTVGFIAKWHLFLALIGGASWGLLLLVALSSLLAIAYVWRLLEQAVFVPAGTAAAPAREAPWSLLLPLLLLAGANLYFGLDTDLQVLLAAYASALLPFPN